MNICIGQVRLQLSWDDTSQTLMRYVKRWLTASEEICLLGLYLPVQSERQGMIKDANSFNPSGTEIVINPSD